MKKERVVKRAAEEFEEIKEELRKEKDKEKRKELKEDLELSRLKYAHAILIFKILEKDPALQKGKWARSFAELFFV